MALVLAMLTGCAKQQSANQSPVDLAHVPISRAAHSSKADDAVPLCPVPFNDSLETNGVVPIGPNGVRPPKLVHSVEVPFSDEAAGLKGVGDVALLGLIVDADGIPKDICLVRSVGYGLDANAYNAVRQYKFDPATKNGKPVPTRVTIEVDFGKGEGASHGLGA
jgi:TonB family protein